jgi:alkylated DNA repair protein (DNA oxidative demethylase)
MSGLFAGVPREREQLEVAPGAVWLKSWLSLEDQLQLVERCRALLAGPGGGYTPTVRGGGKMHVQMMCLGRHWNPLTYTYGPTRADRDDLPVAPVPDDWVALASAAASAAGFSVRPDICLVNFYGADGRMGLHQDKDESAASLEAGAPVVSLSVGDTARFLFGGTRRRDRVETIFLESGDAFVFGGAARLRYHGVSRITPGTAPAVLGMAGRFNLTFRRY